METHVPINEANVRLIFGLKLKQLRLDKGLSQSEMAKRTDISVSYLNEIEKGKKFPKPEKIAQLADSLSVSYDWLVSLQLSKNLAPIGELLKSPILNELPLDVFGIDRSQLFDLLSSAPVKLNAFINTLIEIGRNYGMRVEHFYFSALRSFQELHENYFEEIEQAVDKATQEFAITRPVISAQLVQILQEHYHYQIDEEGLSAQPELQGLRSVILPGKKPRLLLNKQLSDTQRGFILARELGFQYMGITDRSYTTSWVEVSNFEQVLNNFKGSYFACALFLEKDALVEEIKACMQEKNVSVEALRAIMQKNQVSPEMLMHRLTNLLPRNFGISELFFLRFSNTVGTQHFELTKEMHLSGLHNPHTNMLNEHYCRRWVAIHILQNLKGDETEPLIKLQRSKYIGSEREYLIISMAQPALKGGKVNNSVSIGLLLTDSLKKKVKFWNDPSIPIRMVGETCERCMATDCQERVEKPLQIIRQQRIENMKMALKGLS
ncbi:helix-turn-helix domain-containing protein [Cytophagales bacterium LB-30]|uniref:Helix-turn-helix domain-containing protein n=1 Tax=Shiella aurantiaca TaxID=3058365 RepID=A0ABT8F9J5_9BACT|nr:helix-turn-helix domain-containing protein [Shiella aurantiaca]MDN4166871.1 helix-turn-helix domain-containing protein [Shiella aurantiaca]